MKNLKNYSDAPNGFAVFPVTKFVFDIFKGDEFKGHSRFKVSGKSLIYVSGRTLEKTEYASIREYVLRELV